jgi:hypothetical protein
MIPAVFLHAARVTALRAIAFTVWTGMGFPPHTPDAEAIASAIAENVLAMPSAAIWGPEKTAAVMAQFSAEESGNRLDALSYWDYPARGAWQQIGGAGKGSATEQARGWLRLLEQGSTICPAFPLAPLCGGCTRAWRMANRRTHMAWRLVNLEP